MIWLILVGGGALALLAVWYLADPEPPDDIWMLDNERSLAHHRRRRRIWYKLAGLGFLVMVLLAAGLAAASQFVAVVLVTWAYWFGWTWLSWLIADKMALRELQSGRDAHTPAATQEGVE